MLPVFPVLAAITLSEIVLAIPVFMAGHQTYHTLKDVVKGKKTSSPTYTKEVKSYISPDTKL